MPQGTDLPFLVEPMRLGDLDQVMEIERVAFGAPWSAQSYRYEITQNTHSTMLVVRPQGRAGQGPNRGPDWSDRGRHGPVVGYAGFWLLVDQAHISTIATHPDWRGRGLGELLLVSMLDRGAKQGASRGTLEVRASNEAALILYRKYLFEMVGMRKHYYSDNHEDALIMTTLPFESIQFRANLAERRSLLYARLSDLSTVQP